MALDANSQVLGMQHAASAGWPTAELASFFLAEGTNGEQYYPFSINGADHWYDVGPHQVRAMINDLARQTFRPGWLRSVAPGWTNWASESFMDEAAHVNGVDLLVFRQGLLTGQGKNAGSSPNAVGGAKRMSNVLARAAARAGWEKPCQKARVWVSPALSDKSVPCQRGQLV